MGFCHLPVQTAAYNTVPQEKMPRATALNNGFMRIYATFSTAFLATVLHSRSVFHYGHLSPAMTLNRPPVAMVMARLNTAYSAPRVLAAAVQRQSLMSAFSDTFLLLAVFSLFGLALALFLKDDAIREEKHVEG